MQNPYLSKMRDGAPLSLRDQIAMIVRLSIPAILAQISVIVMQYIDAAMVGRLGAADSAAIALSSSSTWLLGGLCMAAGMGFTVEIAKRVGAKDERGARNLVKIGLIVALLFSAVLAVIAASISPFLPIWLGGSPDIQYNATIYFLVFALSLPAVQLNSIAAGMIECSGNMAVPGALEIVMCGMDVLFNALFIFPSRTHTLFGLSLWIPGAGLGVMGAALGTALAELLTSLMLLYYLLFRSPILRLQKGEKAVFSATDLKKAWQIAWPVAVEQIVTCSAYIAFTRIISPLGNASLAAHIFSIDAESFCYMPGYGISAAATTMIGQSIGARRFDLTKKLAWLSTLSGVIVMTFGGVLLYIFAPHIIGVLSPDPEV
ncbi:MAG: MATE family efflux transporter, partial [Clostridia bacterium]|nr:MATE family efflux transporter [Clostridia bacterium]